MRLAILAFPLLALASCANNTTSVATPNYAAIVGMIQSDYPQVVSAANAYCALPHADAQACATIVKVEGVASPLVASLSATSAPTDITAALADVQVILTAPLPAGTLSARTQADLNTGLTILEAVAPIVVKLL